jgi:ribonucleoside-diphosphate reductase alpha chain
MSLRNDIWKRQYAVTKEEDIIQGQQRVADAMAAVDEDPASAAGEFRHLMADNLFWPGGRVLAGAATAHGNMLNCFVTDGSPLKEGSTPWILETARKLALITKVGGGNGVNLDQIQPRQPYAGPVGRLGLYISPSHADADLVRSGTFLNQVTGDYETRGYRHAEVVQDPDSMSGSVRIRVPDSVDGIWSSAAEMSEKLLSGKDVLLDLTDLRAEGEPVRGSGGTSSGPASFAVEVFDSFAYWTSLGGASHAGPVATLRYVFANTLRAIRQGGTRRGAGMATLTATHPDVRDFITCKDLDREQAEGDIGTFNISVLVSDEFMRQSQIPGSAAAGLIREIADHAHQTGEPGVLYVDRINEHNALALTDGPIMSTNPCGEIPLYPAEPCDLGAINLAAHFSADNEFDFELLARTTRTAIRFLDNVLTAEIAPLPDIAEAISDKRRIGLGVMGLADMLIRLGLRYDTAEGREFVARTVGVIRDAALQESCRLGEIRGVPAGPARAGLSRRNIALLTVAPTGTTSMLAECSSGLEPVFAAAYTRRIGTDYRAIVHPLLLGLLTETGSSGSFVTPDGEADWDALAEKINEHHGSIQPLLDQGLLPDDPRLRAFVVAHDIEPVNHVLMQATVQRAFDWKDDTRTYAGNSISKTINLPNEAVVTDVLAAYELGWKEQLKGITVYRDGSRQLQVLTTGPKKKAAAEPVQPAVLASTQEAAPTPQGKAGNNGRADGIIERPAVIQGASFKHELANTKVYVQVFHNQHNQVVEVWTPASKGATPAESTAHEIIGRLASLALKHGAPAASVAASFEGHMDSTGGISRGTGYVGSKWDLVANAIHTVQGTGGPVGSSNSTPDKDACPDCNTTMIRQEGCLTCMACGFTLCG